MQRLIVSIILVVLVLSAGMATAQTVPPAPASNEVFEQLQAAGGPGGANLSATVVPDDPRYIVARVIRVILGIIGTIFLVLMIVAGFIWMTAGGEESRIEKAKGYIKNAVIGLIVVLIAYSLTWLVFELLLEATTGPAYDEFVDY